jgi:uncharacterized delta-60 repeat protein
MAANYAKVVKSVNPPSGVLTGDIVTFTVAITLGSPKNGVTIEDIFAGGGRAPDTDYVPGTAVLDGTIPITAAPSTNQLNRVVYKFPLGNLSAGEHTLTYQWRISALLGCYTNVSNEAHLDVAGVQGHLSTSTISIFVRGCIGPPAPTPTRTPGPLQCAPGLPPPFTPPVTGLPPGTLDPGFGAGGRVITDMGGHDMVPMLAIQPDGKIVAAGSIGPIGSNDFGLARYHPDGTLDGTFGIGGRVSTDFAGLDDGAQAVVLQPDCKIIAVGQANGRSGDGDFGLARYNPDGSLDTTFGLGGKVTTSFGAFDSALGAVLQPDGKLVVCGHADDFLGGEFALARYTADGLLDRTFGASGKVTIDPGGPSSGCSGLALRMTAASWRLARLWATCSWPASTPMEVWTTVSGSEARSSPTSAPRTTAAAWRFSPTAGSSWRGNPGPSSSTSPWHGSFPTARRTAHLVSLGRC